MKNDRRDFIKKAGLLSTASFVPIGSLLTDSKDKKQLSECVLIPIETPGPFPLDLTENAFYFRQDIRENKTGVQLNLKLKIIGESNCFPMQNVRVNIWHCDKDGLYSGYSLTHNQGQNGLTYLRGYQFADVNGEVEFITILPGWYNGRVCHIHFQVYVSSSYAAISQLTFDEDTKQAIYAANPDLYTKGLDPVPIESDFVFADGYQYQLATLTPNQTTGGYDSYLEVTIEGDGVMSSFGHLEKENAKNFSLGQNLPNPYSGYTRIPVNLVHPADVTLDLFDLQGKKLATLQKSNLDAGEHMIDLDMPSLGLPTGNYIYQMTVRNVNGVFIDSKMMTAGR